MYVVHYWYHDPFYVVERSGDYHTYSLTDVFAFCDFVKDCGGSCSCSIQGDEHEKS